MRNLTWQQFKILSVKKYYLNYKWFNLQYTYKYVTHQSSVLWEMGSDSKSMQDLDLHKLTKLKQ